MDICCLIEMMKLFIGDSIAWLSSIVSSILIVVVCIWFKLYVYDSNLKITCNCCLHHKFILMVLTMILRWERDELCILHAYIHHMHMNAHLYLYVVDRSLNGPNSFYDMSWFLMWTNYLMRYYGFLSGTDMSMYVVCHCSKVWT